MTVDIRPKSAAEALKELSARLYKVEQRSSSAQPGVGGSSPWDPNPSVDTITIDGIVVGSDASPATNLVLTTSAFMDDIWVDADWDAPVDGTAANYDVELARKVGASYELVQNYRTGTGTSIRMAGLESQWTYGVRVTAVNRIGERSVPLPSSGFTDITTGIDSTIPAQVTGLSVTGTFRGFIVTWDEVADQDVAHGNGTYQVEWSLANGAGFVGSIIGSEIAGVTVINVGINTFTTLPFYFRVCAIDASGNSGAFSTISAAATMAQVVTADLGNAAVITAKLANLAVDGTKIALLAVDAAQLANSAVTSTKIANLAVGTAAIANLAVGTAQIADASILTAKIGLLQVTTATIADLAVSNAKIDNLAVDNAKINDLDAVKITAGTINASRIAANSIDVDKLTTSTLTSKTITLGSGGTLKIGSPPTTGIFINDQGIRLYSGGVVKVSLDVAGTANFEGNINASTITASTLTSATINSGTITGTTVRTAASGQRVAMETGSISQLFLYSGHGSESAAGSLGVALSGSTLVCQLVSPRSSSNDYAGMTISSVVGGNGSSCNWLLSTGAGSQKATFSLQSASNGAVAKLLGQTISDLDLLFAGGATEAKIVGSGNYCFVYLNGGGTVATINTNVGLGAGIHIMESTNAFFQPIQASAFNIASARKVKNDIRPETNSALARLNGAEVVRFKRNAAPNEELKEIPPHIQRSIDLEEIGLIADDLFKVIPEAVQVGEDGKAMSISLGVLVALLIKAVQELHVLTANGK
jgi:endosialidase-like protein